jgi:hypothetical protein
VILGRQVTVGKIVEGDLGVVNLITQQ